MKTELHYFDIYPLIVPRDKISEIKIREKAGNMGFSLTWEYEIEVIPLDSVHVTRIRAQRDGPGLKFKYLFEGEQEHYLRIIRKDDDHCVGKLSVYSVAEDLYCLKPYKGDLHSHTIYSDGRESPQYIAAAYRKQGYDFLAVTDHRKYYPSIEAMDFYRDVDCGFVILPGEEIHPPDNHVHMVAVGGEYGVQEIIENKEDTYLTEVEDIMARENRTYVEASCIWCAREIKKAGGLSIFCHPFWVNRGYNVDEELSEFFLSNGIFDCFELVGGMERESNNIQISLYNELRSKGVRIPIVGSSDSHRTVNGPHFDRFKTLVFAHELSFPAIAEAVRDLRSVAVEEYNRGEFIVSGPHRYVKYALFLLREFFPLHDELCLEEGRIMEDMVLNGRGSFKSDKVHGFTQRCFGGT